MKESFNIILIDWRNDFKYKYIIIKIVGGKDIIELNLYFLLIIDRENKLNL